jgi:hypothetical protein
MGARPADSAGGGGTRHRRGEPHPSPPPWIRRRVSPDHESSQGFPQPSHPSPVAVLLILVGIGPKPVRCGSHGALPSFSFFSGELFFGGSFPAHPAPPLIGANGVCPSGLPHFSLAQSGTYSLSTPVGLPSTATTGNPSGRPYKHPSAAIACQLKVVFPQLGGAPLFIVRWWLPRDSHCSTCEWDDQPTINILVC